MNKEYRTRVFKSGNSVALRLPKALGIKEGTEMRVREDRGQFIVEPATEKRKISGEGWMGHLPGLKPRPATDRAFAVSPRPWDDPAWPARKTDG